jgi:hypothetical protein
MLLAMVDDDEVENEPEPPAPADRNRGMKRLVQSVIVQAILDFQRSQDRRVWSDAALFLFPQDADRRDFLNQILELSALDPYRTREHLTLMAGKWPYRSRAGR